MENIELYSCEELWEICKSNTKKIFNKAKENYFITISDYEEKTDSNQLLIFNITINNMKRVISLDYILFEIIYKKLKKYNNIDNVVTLGSNNYIETPVQFSNFLTDFQIVREPIIIKDALNNIEYEISLASPEYCLYLDYTLRLENSSNNINTDEIIRLNICQYLSHCLTIFTIKIKTEVKTPATLKKLLNALNFHSMIKCGYSYDFQLNIDELFPINTNLDFDSNNLRTLNAPMQIYQELIVDYYRLACSSYEPFAQYLSYYHVLEYFFDEVFNQHLRKEFQDKITAPHFSYKDEKALDKVINFIKKETRNCKDNGQGNERESLELVLAKFVKLDALREQLNSEQVDYYQHHKIRFCEGVCLSFKNQQNFHKQLAKRIYQTRNALVHSKEGNTGRYKPYQDNEELRQEIPLIKLVAEQIIINSSTPL